MENILNKSLKVLNILLTLVLALFIAIMFSSCDVLKKTVKNQEDRTLTESTETLTKRMGDTVRYEIPNIILKDTTIYKTNRVTGTTQTVRYNDKGMIDLVECQSGAIEELKRENKTLVEAIKEKDKTKETEFNSEIIIYFMLGLVGIVFILAYLGYRYISKNTDIVKGLVSH